MGERGLGVLKFLNKWRWRGSWYDLCGDGRFPKERLKGKDKKMARKRTLRKMKEIDRKLENQ